MSKTLKLGFILSLSFAFNCTEDKTIISPEPDRVPPDITWHQPAPDAELSGLVEVSFTVKDNSTISRIVVYRNGFNPPEWSLTPAPQDTLHLLYWDTRAVSDGLYILEIRAWDEYDNIGISPSLMVKVHNQSEPPGEDRTPPDVWFESPAPGATLRDTVRLAVGYFDESGVDSICAYKDGIAWGGFPNPPDSGGFGNPPYAFLWDTRADSDGVHLWQARAWDAVGNIGVSIALLVRVKNNPDPPPEDHTPPVVNWLSPQPGDTLQGNVDLRFQAMDNVGIDSVYLFINGRSSAAYTLQVQQDILYSFEWLSNDFEDGSYYIEIRAKDLSGNIGFLPPVNFMVWNNRPRVIWVPDDYPTIQGAINASRDGDTVRVRAGVYAERLDLLDKIICLESESGPDLTVLDEREHSAGICVFGGQDTTLMIRGFKIAWTYAYGIWLDYQSSAKFCNNIITCSGWANLNMDFNAAIIQNNVFADNGTERNNNNIQIRASYGRFENNMMIRNHGEVIWNVELDENPLIVRYCSIWQYDRLSNRPPIRFDDTNLIDIDPLLSDSLFHLSDNSPCIDSGNPDLLDPDGSRSDIGAYGGPYAYPIRR